VTRDLSVSAATRSRHHGLLRRRNRARRSPLAAWCLTSPRHPSPRDSRSPALPRRVIVVTSTLSSRTLAVESRTMKRTTRLDLMQGTLDLLIPRPADRAHARLGHLRAHPADLRDVLQINQGSSTPPCTAWNIKAGSRPSGAVGFGPPSAFLRLTASGRKQLEHEADQWARLTAAIRTRHESLPDNVGSRALSSASAPCSARTRRVRSSRTNSASTSPCKRATPRRRHGPR